MTALSELLKLHQGDRSVRQIGRDCGKYGVGESTVIPYFSGKHGDNPPEEVLYALSQVMPLDIGLLREAAGVPRGESDPYVAPAEFSRLTRAQRAALDEFVRSFVGPQEEPAAPRSRAPRKKVSGNQVKAGLSFRNPSAGDSAQHG